MTAEEAATTAHDTARRDRLRWGALGLLLGVVVAGLVVSALVFVGRGVPGDRLGSLSDPPADVSEEREKVLAAGRTFVQRFNTYGPDLLDDGNQMPDYAAVGDLMTGKFRTVFDKNVGYAEETVVQTQIDRVGTPYAVGVAALDDDSAELLVAGIVEFSYPSPDDETEQVSFEPVRFRYQVSMVKVDGTWLVDDLDDVDDELPSFAQAEIPESGVPGGGAPSDGTPSDAPTGPAPSEGEGEQP